MNQREHDKSSLFHESIPIIHISDVKHMPIEFQIDKIWPINSVGFMSGQPGVCKSWLAWEIAICIASGTKLFGQYECRKGKVLAFNAEDDLAMVTRSRIEAFAHQKGLDIKNLDLHLLDVPIITLNDNDIQEQLEITIEQYEPDFLIFDPLRNVHSLDEDKATEMSAKLLHFLRKINRKYSCSILLVCHDKKLSKDIVNNRPAQVRGTSALIGWRDNAIYLDKEKNGIVRVETYNRACQSILPFCFILQTKNNNHGDLETAQLVVTTQDQIDDQKELIQLQAVKKVIIEHGPMTKDDIVKRARINRQRCLKHINTLIESDDDVIITKDGLIMING